MKWFKKWLKTEMMPGFTGADLIWVIVGLALVIAVCYPWRVK